MQNKLFKARNLHEVLAVSSDLGWRVVGACSGPNSVTSNELGSDKPTILVMVRRLISFTQILIQASAAEDWY